MNKWVLIHPSSKSYGDSLCAKMWTKPPLWFQRLRDLGQEELIGFHVLEELDRDHSIQRLRLKVMRDHISNGHLQIR